MMGAFVPWSLPQSGDEPSKEALEAADRYLADNDHLLQDRFTLARAMEDYAAARVVEARAQERERCDEHIRAIVADAEDLEKSIRALSEQEQP